MFAAIKTARLRLKNNKRRKGFKQSTARSICCGPFVMGFICKADLKISKMLYLISAGLLSEQKNFIPRKMRKGLFFKWLYTNRAKIEILPACKDVLKSKGVQIHRL